MSFLDIAKSRYATKKYNPDAIIPDEKIQDLKEILRLSPSSINSQPWNFIFVSEKDLKQKLAGVSFFNEHKIADASHLVVFCAVDNIIKFEEHLAQNLPEAAFAYYNAHIKVLSEVQIKSWLQHQVYLSLGFFLSACATMGIDSTPMEGIQNDAYAKILNIKDYWPLFAVALGHRATDDVNQPSLNPKSRLSLEKIIQNL